MPSSCRRRPPAANERLPHGRLRQANISAVVPMLVGWVLVGAGLQQHSEATPTRPSSQKPIIKAVSPSVIRHVLVDTSAPTAEQTTSTWPRDVARVRAVSPCLSAKFLSAPASMQPTSDVNTNSQHQSCTAIHAGTNSTSASASQHAHAALPHGPLDKPTSAQCDHTCQLSSCRRRPPAANPRLQPHLLRMPASLDFCHRRGPCPGAEAAAKWPQPACCFLVRASGQLL